MGRWATCPAYDLDGPVPEPTNPQVRSIAKNLLALAARDKLTIRQLYTTVAAGFGTRVVIGTPAQVVDDMQEWIEAGVADGFNLCPPLLPGSLDDFVAMVLPELRRRGLFRTEYEHSTLRGNLGLPMPRNRYEAARTAPSLDAGQPRRAGQGGSTAPARSVIGPYWSGRRCAAKLNIFVLALPAQVEVAIGDQQLVAEARRFGDDAAIRVDDARAADQPGPVLVAGLGDRHRPGRVHVGVGLHHQLGMEGAQRGVLGGRRRWGRRRRSCSRRRPARRPAARARARLPASAGRCRSSCR